MIDVVIRFIKRFAVLLPGLVVVYFAATDIYPALEKRIPAALALLGAYVIAAYLLIPMALRLLRLLFPAKHLPLYCVTPDGFASDPINIGLVGTQEMVKKAMSAAGWFESDPRSFRNLVKMGLALLMHRSYPNAPFSNLYLFGRKQDFGYQLPVQNSPQNRHHVRFWASEPKLSDTQEADLKFWSRHQLRRQKKQPTLWVGAASLDVGLGIIRHNGQLTHMVHPDTDAERDLIVKQLRDAKQVKKSRSTTIGTPYKLRNRVMRGRLDADGKMTIIELKP